VVIQILPLASIRPTNRQKRKGTKRSGNWTIRSSRAPFNGVVTQVDQLQPGVYLVASTAALTNTGAVALVATDDIWIEANFKETDLTWVKPGDSVEISVDSYPQRSWTGK
jgi:multidrug resistance efflux pump